MYDLLKRVREFIASHKKYQIPAILALLIIATAIPITLYQNQQQQNLRQHAATSACDTIDNLVQNCNFEKLNANGFPTDWTDVRNDPKRQAAPGQYSDGVGVVTTPDNLKTIQLGKEAGTCDMPKSFDGGDKVAGPFKVFSEIRQHAYVGTANAFTFSFDYQMKSRQTAPISAPFYIFAAFSPGHNRDDQSKGREVFLAYTPHNEDDNQFCTSPFRTDYSCMIGLSGYNRTDVLDCSDSYNSWKHIEVIFLREELCKVNGTVDPGCVSTNDELSLDFGVTNDYDTVVLIDNVSFKAAGMDRSKIPHKANLYIHTPLLEEGQTTAITATGLTECSSGISLESGSGLTCGNPIRTVCGPGNTKDSNPCWFEWSCSGKTIGSYTATFSVPGSPSCTATKDYTISASIQPTDTLPPTDETIDTLDYFLTNHPDKGLTGTHPISQTVDGQKSYLVKWASGNFEIHTWDDNYIYLKEDNSGQPVNFYTFNPGIWMKRQMKTGETIAVNNNVIQWYDPSCSTVDTQRSFPIAMMLEKHDSSFNAGGDLGTQDVIVLKYDSAVNLSSGTYERFYYSREWGLILWEAYDKATNAKTSSSTFNKITNAPTAPDKQTVCDPSLRTPVISPTEEPTPTQTPTPTSSPTPTPTPTPTFTPTPTPTPKNSTLSLSLTLPGIGMGLSANPDPNTKTRQVSVCLYTASQDPSHDPSCSRALVEKTGTVTFDQESKTFDQSNFDLGVVPDANYQVLIKTTGYLRKKVTNLVHIAPDTKSYIANLTLPIDDINGDNFINVEDYNAYLDCFDQKKNASSCQYKNTVDLNDDGQIDNILNFSDYKLFIQNFTIREGD